MADGCLDEIYAVPIRWRGAGRAPGNLLPDFYLVVTLGVAWLVFALYDLFKVPGYRYDPAKFRWTVLIGWTTNLISIGFKESFYSYGHWKESVRREYEIRQLHMQRQLDVLKQQVNPDFLFNSLTHSFPS